MKILWLCSWYPNKLKHFDGDFIQRHARAVSMLHEVNTIFIKKDDEGMITGSVDKQVNADAGLVETIIYYKPVKTGVAILDKILSNNKYNSLFKEAVEEYIRVNGAPDLVHVHVAMKAGSTALWMKKRYGIPFIVSEHWTGFLTEAKPGIKEQGFYFGNMCSAILKQASAITVVSKVLADAVSILFGLNNIKVIPNVVDTSIFYPVVTTPGKTRFIHVSTMTWQKNIEQILEACKILASTDEFILQIYTPEPVRCHDLVKQYQLDGLVEISAEVPQQELGKAVQQADALILYSRYETFGCVVIEANACGVPAILSDLPVFHEYSIENKTAVFAPLNDPKALAEKMKLFINNKDQFDKEEISKYISAKFSYEAVTKQFDELYKSLRTPSDVFQTSEV